jgi:hypothetical protein
LALLTAKTHEDREDLAGFPDRTVLRLLLSRNWHFKPNSDAMDLDVDLDLDGLLRKRRP